MNKEATIIYPDGREEKVSPANGNDFSLEEVQKIVGGYIEVVGLFRRHHPGVAHEGRRRRDGKEMS